MFIFLYNEKTLDNNMQINIFFFQFFFFLIQGAIKKDKKLLFLITHKHFLLRNYKKSYS